MSKVQEDEKKRKRQGHDEFELVETSEVWVTKPRAHKRRKTTELLPRQVNATAKSPLNTTSKARFRWKTKTKEAFFEGLCKHGKDFERICVFMNSKPHLKHITPNLSRNQVRFFYYRTWKLVSGYYTAIKQKCSTEPSKQSGVVENTEASTSVGGAISSTCTKEYLTDEELYCDESQPAVELTPVAVDIVEGGAKEEVGNIGVEEEMFSDEDRVTPPVIVDTEKDELSDNTEHESEDDSDDDPSPMDGTTEEQEQEDPLPAVGGAEHRATQEPAGGAAIAATVTLTGKVEVDGKMMPLDLVSLICYGKYRSKLQALGNKREIGTKLYQLVHSGVTAIRYKGRRMQLKMPLCVALKHHDSRSTEPSHDGIVTGGIPDGSDHLILKLTAYNSDSWSHIQQLSFNPRLRIVLPGSKTLSSTMKLLTERWNLSGPDGGAGYVKVFHWSPTSSYDDASKERVDWCSQHVSCDDHEDHMALELPYDGDTTLNEIAIKLKVKNNLELMYDISGLVQKSCISDDRMESLLRVVKGASKNEKMSNTPRVLSRISPRKYSLFGSPFQRLAAHRIGFGSRTRMKLDFSSPKKGEGASAPPVMTTATPTDAEEGCTLDRSPDNKCTNVTLPTPVDKDPGVNLQPSSACGVSQSQRNDVKSCKSFKGNKRNRIVTFDEHQLNHSGSFSSIPIKDLLILAQQQVNNRSPKKRTALCSSLSPQSSPPMAHPKMKQRVPSVTAVTIPSDQPAVSTHVSTSAAVPMVTATSVSSLQQGVGGASCSSNTTTHPAVLTTSITANQSTTVTAQTTSIPEVTSCVSNKSTVLVTTFNPISNQPDVDAPPSLPPIQTRPAKIIHQRPARPITNQRNLVPQPLSFFNASGKRVNNSSVPVSAQASNANTSSVVEDTSKMLKVAESIKQQQQSASGKRAPSLNVQNLTLVQQIQLLALIQQYQTMQKPKPVTSQTSATQPPVDKALDSNQQQFTDETFHKLNPEVPGPATVTNSCAVNNESSDEIDAELYKLMHATPIRTPKKLPSLPLPVDEVSSDTVNNLLSSLMKGKQVDRQQQDLARLASETADLLPSFAAGLLQHRSDGSTVDRNTTPVDPNLPELLLNGDSVQKQDHLPSLDSDSNPLGLLNFDNLLEDPDNSLGAIIAYLESPKKKLPPNSSSIPDLFSHDHDLNNIASMVNHSNSSEDFSFQALLEDNSQDLSNKFRELSGILTQHIDTPPPFNT